MSYNLTKGFSHCIMNTVLRKETEKMFCNQCGTKNPDNVKFCNECGAKMLPASTASTIPTPVAVPKSAVTPQPVTTSQDKTTSAKDNMSIEDKLATLSTSTIHVENKVASRRIDPIEDPYWDDVLPEIDNEIYAIPKDNLIKIAASILALFAVIAWLIYML